MNDKQHMSALEMSERDIESYAQHEWEQDTCVKCGDKDYLSPDAVCSESKLNRDIENYSDNCDVERELKESDEVTWENGDLCAVENLDGKHQFGCDVPNSDLVIVFCCESGAPSTVNKDRLMKIDHLEEKSGKDLFYLHKASIIHARLFSAYDSEWDSISDKCRKYWIHFAKQLGFTTGI